MEDCLLKIKEYFNSYSKQEIKLANYILDNPKLVSEMNIIDLSKNSFVSCSTINRFVTHLGFEGYKEFSKSLYHEVNTSSRTDNIYDATDEKPIDLSLDSIVDAVSKINVESILNSIKMVDKSNIKKAIELINNANRVVIFALSGSYSVALDLEFKLQRLGIVCQVYNNAHSFILAATTLTKKDIALVISYTGETKDIINGTKFAKESGAKVISITMIGDNTLSNLSNVSIQHSSVDRGKRTFSTRSRVVQENIVDILFIGLCTIRQKYLEKYYEIFENNYTIK